MLTLHQNLRLALGQTCVKAQRVLAVLAVCAVVVLGLAGTVSARAFGLDETSAWSQDDGTPENFAPRARTRYAREAFQTSAQLDAQAIENGFETGGFSSSSENEWRTPSLGRFLSRDAKHYDSANLYNATFASRGWNDPTGHWGEGGHFYTTYIAMKQLGMSDAEAEAMAYWSQYPDENGLYDAMDGGHGAGLGGKLGSTLATTFNKDSWAAKVREDLHVLRDSDPVPVRNALCCLLNDKSLSNMQRGIILHAYGDAFAHVDPKTGKLFGPDLGHGKKFHIPDTIGSDKKKYLDYMKSLLGCMGQGGPEGANNNLVFMTEYANYIGNANFPTSGAGSFDDHADMVGEANILRNFRLGYQGDLHPEGIPATMADGSTFYIGADNGSYANLAERNKYADPTQDQVRGVMDLIDSSIKNYEKTGCCKGGK